MDLVEISRKIITGKNKMLEGLETKTYLAFWLEDVLTPISACQH